MPHDTTGSGEVLVAPRYLAGTTGTDPVAPLLDTAPGWTQTLVGPDPYYTSPCQRLRAARRQGGAWTFTYASDPLGMPTWSAHFDRTTPDEALTAFTGRLIDGVGNYFADYLYGGRYYDGQTPASIFAEHEWKPVRGSRPWHMLAPDEHAAFHIRTGHVDDHDELRHRSAATWKITAGPDPISQPTWSAHFTGHTPQPLMTAVADAIASPHPVARLPHRVPEPHRPLVSLHPSARTARAAAAQARSRPSPTAAPSTHESSPAPASAHSRPARRR